MGQVVLDRETHDRVTLLANAWEVTDSEAIRRLVAMFAKNKTNSGVTANASREEASGGIAVHAVYQGERIAATYDPTTRAVTVTDGPRAGEWFKSPTGAARAVVEALKPSVSPHRNGWSFWIVTDTGKFLQSIR